MKGQDPGQEQDTGGIIPAIADQSRSSAREVSTSTTPPRDRIGVFDPHGLPAMEIARAQDSVGSTKEECPAIEENVFLQPHETV